jgi:hypothetical protein
MSAPRWREWFCQVKKTPPDWLAKAGTKIWKPKLGAKIPKGWAAILPALNELWPDGDVGHKASERDRLINKWLKDHQERPLGPRTIQRAIKMMRFA